MFGKTNIYQYRLSLATALAFVCLFEHFQIAEALETK